MVSDGVIKAKGVVKDNGVVSVVRVDLWMACYLNG